MASVIVVGAGPARVTLSYLLARAGIEVTLLERETDAEYYPARSILPGQR